MTQGIWAVWYDLSNDDTLREEYLDWFHGTHLPGLLSRSGFAWAAHYRIVGGGARMDEIHDRLARPDDPDLGAGTQFLALVGATVPHVFFEPKVLDIEPELSPEASDMLALRRESRTCFFTEEAQITGPASGSRSDETAPAPAIQMGSFRTKTVADEFDLAAWYAQYRLPAMSRMPGCVATRKLVSLAGWAKHSILYEFTSLEARERHFQGHESLALDDTVWTSKIIGYTIHAPGSPSVGYRLWPEVTETERINLN
jgi:hypothetical protein